MFNKILGGQLISDDERTARRNSFAMLDALEATNGLNTVNCRVGRLYIEPDWRSAYKSKRDIEFFIGSLHDALNGNSGFKKSYDEYETEIWYLVIAVRKVFAKNNHELQTIEAVIVYAVGSEIDGFNFSCYAKQMLEEDEKVRSHDDSLARVLVAAYKPDRVVRVFAKDIFATLDLAVTTMIEEIESPLSSKELASSINKKTKEFRSRGRRSMLEFAPIDIALHLEG
jgi:hypothetical protein